MKYKIEKGIEIPESSVHGRERKYPFDMMDVGDSFAAPSSEMQRISSAANHYGKKHKKKFSGRVAGGEYRLWRVE